MPEYSAVKLWRDKFRLNLSASWKRDVEVTVKDLDLWKEILDGWFYFDAKGKKQTRHPGIKGLLTEYERQDHDRQLEKRNADNQAASVSTRSGAGLSEGGDGFLRQVRSEAPRQYFRTR